MLPREGVTLMIGDVTLLLQLQLLIIVRVLVYSSRYVFVFAATGGFRQHYIRFRVGHNVMEVFRYPEQVEDVFVDYLHTHYDLLEYAFRLIFFHIIVFLGIP